MVKMDNNSWQYLNQLYKESKKPIKVSKEIGFVRESKNIIIIERYISVINNYEIDHFGFPKPKTVKFIDDLKRMGEDDTRKDAFIMTLRRSSSDPILYIIDRGTKILLSKGVVVPSHLVRKPDKAIEYARNEVTKGMI